MSIGELVHPPPFSREDTNHLPQSTSKSINFHNNMKSLLILVFIVSFIFGTAVAHDKFHLPEITEIPNISTETQEKLLRIISLSAVNYLRARVIDGEERFEVFPPFPEDAISLNPVNIHISEDSGIADWIYGDIDFCDVRLYGLRSIWNDLQIDISSYPRISLDFQLRTGNISLSGNHDILLNILSPLLKIAANEAFFVESYNFTVEIHSEFVILDGRVNVTDAVLNIYGDGLGFYFENAYINETLYIGEWLWALLSNALSDAVDPLWLDTQQQINEDLPGLLYELFKDCYVFELIGGSFDCVGGTGTESTKIQTVEEMLMAEINDLVQFSKSSLICPAASEWTTASTSTTLPTTTAGVGIINSNILPFIPISLCIMLLS